MTRPRLRSTGKNKVFSVKRFQQHKTVILLFPLAIILIICHFKINKISSTDASQSTFKFPTEEPRRISFVTRRNIPQELSPTGKKQQKNQFSVPLEQKSSLRQKIQNANIDQEPKSVITSKLPDLDPKSFTPPRLPSNPNFIFHNKMPKCGSTTLLTIVKSLQNQNNFKFLMINSFRDQYRESIAEMHKFRTQIAQQHQNKVTDNKIFIMQHQTYINFTQHRYEYPTYINVVRNPIDRYISNYYFCRFGSANNGFKAGQACQPDRMSESMRNMPVEEYLNLDKAKLSTKNINFLQWICGRDTNCVVNERIESSKTKAYEFSKKLVMQDYFMIGILEEFDQTLELFEFLLPEYFKGASQMYHSRDKRDINGMQTSHKGTITPKTRQKMEQTFFSYDMDLYEFIKAKFHRQYDYFLKS